MTHCCESK